MSGKSNFWLVLLSPLVMLLWGCGKASEPIPISTPTDDREVELSQVIEADYLLPLLDENRLWLVDPQSTQRALVAQLEQSQLPAVASMEDIQLSPKRDSLVWYAPTQGFLVHNLQTQETRVLRPANDWLNTNPYFTFDSAGSDVYLVDDEGTHLYQLSLSTTDISSVEIPFPFGTIFKISPDNQKIIFVAAFGQSSSEPEYMFTDIKGQNPVRFTTNTPLQKRASIYWLPDSSGVVTISSESELVFISSQTGRVETFWQHSLGGDITQLQLIDSSIYYATTESKYHVIDVDSKQEVGRIPFEIAADIQRPQFFPWYDKQFLIEETVRSPQLQFNRLWRTNYVGVKEVVMEQYNPVQVVTDELEL